MKVLLRIKPNLQQISHKDIQNVESRLKFSIPDSLKELLLHYNGGDLGVNVFYTKFEDGDQRLYELYHLNSLEEIESAWGKCMMIRKYKRIKSCHSEKLWEVHVYALV
ncbi:SMI1/KNR4 family protein [Rhodocytophaga rosea]|uniref:SMI1/KNR4 family protein n=1 Tax=Rhodocytophaga rosea TaxID=2704465 RepID=A0A6C0GH42_9BACT|nr:SMI1/KNR4 family protein [Rhodocytophaga rosea]QHT67010.1 SMI1/KNR4 family protein [Rhodocytophaga rosea]